MPTVASMFDRLRAARAPRRPSGATMFRDEIDRERPELATDYIGQEVESITSSRMPAFMGELQSIRENAIRRGVTGPLGTSYEGDLASAFQRNIANEVGSRSYDSFQRSRDRRLDLITGQRDYETAQANAKRKRGGLFGKIIGTVAGSVLGPFGAAAGNQLADRIFK